MSGSTWDSRIQQYYGIRVETPCISFVPDPSLAPGKVDTTEMDFHQNARDLFGVYLDGVVDRLDAFVMSIVNADSNKHGIIVFNAAAACLYDWNREELRRKGAAKCRVEMFGVGSVPGVWGDITIGLTFSRIPEEDDLEALRLMFTEFFREYHRTIEEQS